MFLYLHYNDFSGTSLSPASQEDLQRVEAKVDELGEMMRALLSAHRQSTPPRRHKEERTCTATTADIPINDVLVRMKVGELRPVAVLCGLSPSVGGASSRTKTDMILEIEAVRQQLIEDE